MRGTLFIAAAIVFVGLGCAPATEGPPGSAAEKAPLERIEAESGGRNPWTDLGLSPASEVFRFAVVSDRTGGHRPGVFASAIPKLNDLRPDFVLSVGDLVEGYGEDGEMSDPAAIESGWQEVESLIADLEMPFFYVVGNNDISSEAMAPAWQERFGRTYYSFRFRDVLFLALSSEDPPKSRYGQVSEAQLTWLRETLAKNADVRWTFVFLHRPLWAYEEEGPWASVDEILDDRPRTVFAGHHHRFAKTTIRGFDHYTLATTGGFSRMEGIAKGNFDHIAWVTMTPEGPRIANLMLEGIYGDDPVGEAAAMPEAETAAP